MDKEIEERVAACQDCQKNRDRQPKLPLYTWNVAAKPWERIHLDFAGEFMGLIAVDSFSKWVEVALMKSTTEKTIKIMEEWIARNEVPRQIITDNGPQFIAKEFATACKKWGIQHIKVTPYHPQSNGMAERFIRTLKSRIREEMEREKDVKIALNRVLFTYRNAPHKVTKRTPAELFFSRKVDHWLDRLQPDPRRQLEKGRQEIEKRTKKRR
ncbi:PREDICTED: uncharacterized protein K02A2.6-like [Cyphomyrmex costatus]|uniref:uncharacterized protein K02A2.6-like n=1 Tax=Cyphomyrmex costatus TaxID=456900 RepID=UPI00085234EF|nr:PREDICTED: uncharacterized protein K02A2.6-like [Cyphomyrmex costatus]